MSSAVQVKRGAFEAVLTGMLSLISVSCDLSALEHVAARAGGHC
jgi:hypothetical protein